MIHTFIQIFGLLDKKRKQTLPIIIIMILIETIFESLSISLIVPFVTAVMDENIITDNKVVHSVCDVFLIQTLRSFIIFCIISLLVLYSVKCVFSLFESRTRYNFICKARHTVQKKIFASILDRPYEYFLSSQSSEIIRQVSDDCNRTFELLGLLLDVLSNVILTVGIGTVLLIIDTKMTIVVLVMMVVLAFVLITIVKPILRKSGQVLVKYASANYRNLLEAIQGIKIVKITKSEDYFNKEFKINGEKVIEANRNYLVFNAMPLALTEFVCIATVLIYILVLYINNTDINDYIPTIGAFVVASLKLIPASKKIINAYSGIAFNKAAVDMVLDNYKKIPDAKQTIKTSNIPLEKSVELKNITYSYPNSYQKILNHASLTIPAGKSVGIIGLSGIGKSTTADIILGLLKPQDGCVAFDGKECFGVNVENYPIKFGYVPQNIFITDDTIKKNIAFGVDDKNIDNCRITEAIKAAQLEDFISSLTDGIDTNIGENGVRISGGQKQRIGIARALYNNPDLLVFDEATSSLDIETEASVIKAIEALQGKKTMLIIAHRPQVIQGCDYIYRMVDGRFVSEKQ